MWFANPMHLRVNHVLHDRWWSCTLVLCAAADLADVEVWELAWQEMREIGMEHARMIEGRKDCGGVVSALMESTPLDLSLARSVADRKALLEPGWTQGAAGYALSHAHHGAFSTTAETRAGCERMLAQLLDDGGLTRQDVVDANILLSPEGAGVGEEYRSPYMHKWVARKFPDVDEYDMMQRRPDYVHVPIMAFSEEEARRQVRCFREKINN